MLNVLLLPPRFSAAARFCPLPAPTAHARPGPPGACSLHSRFPCALPRFEVPARHTPPLPTSARPVVSPRRWSCPMEKENETRQARPE
ncbi:hypothetical protein B0H12DRAFT_1111591 [Mycena haematopus]|nr:hypothetical protein B0H12DRAFT_1111591 [Mycena haematopus]